LDKVVKRLSVNR